MWWRPDIKLEEGIIMFKDLSISQFLSELGSGNPAPGGGAAAAISGAMGASLISMYCRVTANKKKFVEVKEEMEAFANEADSIKEKLFKLADADSNSYIDVMGAFKLPKETDEEKAKRAEAIELASQKATEIPLETAVAILPLLKEAASLAKKGNPNAISDLKVGLELCYTGYIGAMSNVEINLPGLKDQDFKQAINDKLEEVQSEAFEAVDAGRESIHEVFEAQL